MSDEKQNFSLSRRNLMKMIAAGSSVGFIGVSSGQSATPLDSIATETFANTVTETTFIGEETQQSVYSTPAHGYPLTGESYLVMSSGSAEDILGSPTEFHSTSTNGVQIENYSPDGYVANDVATFNITLTIPENAETIAFDYRFATEENPSFLQSAFQDFFEAVVFPPDGGPQNIALLPDGAPVTVQNSNEFANSPGGSSQDPSAPLPDSPDTVFNSITETQTATWNVSGYQGEEVSLFFRVADATDSIFDSAVLIDNLRFADSDDLSTDLSKVESALDEFETAYFDAIDEQLRALANAEARYYKQYGTSYSQPVIDYFGKKAGVITDGSIETEVETLADDGLNGGPSSTSAEQLYTFYKEMYGNASQEMSEGELTTYFYKSYRGTHNQQSQYLTFDVGASSTQSSVLPLAEDGKTFEELVEFTQDCIVGTAQASGIKQEILQTLAESDVAASTVEALANAIRERTAQLEEQKQTSTNQYDETAEILCSDSEFKAEFTVPELNTSETADGQLEPQLAITTAVGAGAMLKTVGVIGGGSAMLSLAPAAIPAAANTVGTVTTAIGSGFSAAQSYLGGQVATGSALSSAQSIATAQTIHHYTRLQGMSKLFQLIDTATGALECGTTAFDDFYSAASATASGETSSDAAEIFGFELSDVEVENLTFEDQLPNSKMARGTGSVTVTNTGLLPLTPDFSSSRITEVIAYTGIETGANQPIAFGSLPEINPGDSAVIEFEYLAPVGGLMDLVTEYQLKLTEKQTNTTQSTSFNTEALDVEVSVPTTTVSSGSLGTGQTATETVSPASDAQAVTFTLDYEQYDADLHLYDQSGNHTGFDYTTSEIENEIPGATHSGDDEGITKGENITVVDPKDDEYTLEIVVEEVGTVTQGTLDVHAQQTSPSRGTSVEATAMSQSEPMAVSPIDAQATGAGTTAYSTELTELTPQPPEMAVSSVTTAVAPDETTTTPLSVNELGTFVDLQSVELALPTELTAESGGNSLPSSVISITDAELTVPAGQTKTTTIVIDAPSSVSSGQYSGIIEATATTSDGEITDTAPVTVDVKESEAPQPTVSRSLSTVTASPGEEVSVTVEAVASSSAITVYESFSPSFDTAIIEDISLDSGSGEIVLNQAQSNGIVVTANNVAEGEAMTIEYSVRIPQSIEDGTTFLIAGEYTSGDTSQVITETEITAEVGPFDGIVADYNSDNDDDIDITELGQAAGDYANDEITITELGEVAATYSNT